MENIYNPYTNNQEIKLTKIKAENLRLRAYIGFKEWETHKLQDLVISYSFLYNAAKAIQSDSETDALDYKKINKSIIKLVDRQRFYLLEKLTDDIYQLSKKIFIPVLSGSEWENRMHLDSLTMSSRKSQIDT